MRRLLLILALTAWGWAQPVSFPDGYPGSAEEIRVTIARAQGRIDRFAQEHGWEALLRPVLYDSCEIFDSGAALLARIRQIHSLPEDVKQPTATVVGALEKRILLFVSPDEFARVVPELAAELNAYEKLMAHEIAHRLHVAILAGDEERMGPRWFYEGFAVVASGQHQGAELGDPEAAMASASYRDFGALVRALMDHVPLEELVRRAGDSDFEAWALHVLQRSR